MEKGRKLRRYSRKDYSQLVDFPVEIVGRDGVVRRYSFEESVRLYQRRIQSASLRYGDDEIVTAELRHCRCRIEQLRRSYVARYGWPGVQGGEGADAPAGELAADVAAFLRRWLDSAEVDPESLELRVLEAETADGIGPTVFFVRKPSASSGSSRDSSQASDHLLYLYRFEEGGSCPSRDQFFKFLKVLQGVRRASEGVETLNAFHHTGDCGLILTGNASAAGQAPVESEEQALPPIDLSWMDGEVEASDPLREGMALLRQGDREQALRSFMVAYEQNHYRRAAYLGAAVVADQLGEHVEGETAALMGTRYFPDDAALHYHLAVARLRRGDCGEARAALLQAARLEGRGSFAIGLVGALIELRDGRVGRGRRRLRSLPSPDAHRDGDLIRARRWVMAQVTARSALLLASGGLAAIGVALSLFGAWWALLATVVGLSLMPLIHIAWIRQVARVLEAPGNKGLRLANPGALQQLGEGTRRSQ